MNITSKLQRYLLSPPICMKLVLLLLLLSCRKEKTDYAQGTNENINTWISDSLKRYYYWNESLPSHPDIRKPPKAFFSAEKNAADRFSFIILPSDPSTFDYSVRELYGFDYAVVKETSSDEVAGVVKFVLRDSPASRAGLKRGDYIGIINGRRFTETNANDLLNSILAGSQLKLTMSVLNSHHFSDTYEIELDKGVTFEQPSLTRIFDIGGKKIAYLYISDFNTGLAASLYNVFAGFKSEGVTELILDLRYNSGGQVAEAAALCAMIAPSVSYSSPFIIYKGNKNGGTRTESIGSAATFDGTADFNTLIQNNLRLNRIFILSTGTTASASEVMINNLKPFMKVFLVGEPTRGKDEASFRIYDARVPREVDWEMHPIIYKLFNSEGNGGYSSGIVPDIAVRELDFLPLLELGGREDPLIKTALKTIAGEGFSSVLKNYKIKGSDNQLLILSDSREASIRRSVVTTHR